MKRRYKKEFSLLRCRITPGAKPFVASKGWVFYTRCPNCGIKTSFEASGTFVKDSEHYDIQTVEAYDDVEALSMWKEKQA